MSGRRPAQSDGDGIDSPKIWGRRAYLGKEARELANDVSRAIARRRPEAVDDPDDPTLADVIRHSDLGSPTIDGKEGPKARALSILMRHGLDFQEAVYWYWFRYCLFDVTEIHYAMTGKDCGGDPEQRRNAIRNVKRVLKSAASKLPDADPDEVPDMVDERKRHDREG